MFAYLFLNHWQPRNIIEPGALERFRQLVLQPYKKNNYSALYIYGGQKFTRNFITNKYMVYIRGHKDAVYLG
jgi:hypothetical protein